MFDSGLVVAISKRFPVLGKIIGVVLVTISCCTCTIRIPVPGGVPCGADFNAIAIELNPSLPPGTLAEGVRLPAEACTMYCVKLPNITSADNSEKPGPAAMLLTGNV